LPGRSTLAEEQTLAEKFLKHGDESAFRALYRRHTPMLYRIAYRMAFDAEHAAEIVQDTWIRAAEKLRVFRWESSLPTWLAGIAINCGREEARRVRSQPKTVSELTERGVEPRISERLDLEQGIRKLADGYREILVLHDMEGYTHEEIGMILEIEASTSRSQLARARAAIRNWLEQKTERR
jgi:RNA polymerase sigma-70 factor, ECF subfamily